MPANVDAMVREGIAAFKASNKEDARTYLMKAVELDPYHEQAWLWLSAAVDTPEDQRTCLENVLAINPENERARSGLQLLSQQVGTPSSTPATPPPSNAFETSVEWEPVGMETSSPSAQPARDMPEVDYDSWVTNLNLPAGSSEPASPSDTFGASPFGGVNPFGEEDIFTSGPFSTADFEDVFTPPPSSPKPPGAMPAAAPPAAKMSPGREAPAAVDDMDDLKGSALFADFDDDFSDVELGELNAEELFSYIPAEIKATRLPGTKERYPILLVLALLVLVLLNAGAAALLVSRMIVS